MNRKGPKAEPCGTPALTGLMEDRWPLHDTWKLLLLRYDFIILIIFIEMCSCVSLSENVSCQTESNASVRSSEISPVRCFLPMLVEIVSNPDQLLHSEESFWEVKLIRVENIFLPDMLSTCDSMIFSRILLVVL